MSPIVPPQLIVLRYCDTAKQEIIQRIVFFLFLFFFMATEIACAIFGWFCVCLLEKRM